MTEAKYPEHERMEKVSQESQSIGEFLEWLSEKGIEMGRIHSHDDGCHGPHNRMNCISEFAKPCHCPPERTDLICGWHEDEMMPTRDSMEDLIAEFFGIDLTKIEKEKREMIEDLRKARSRP